MALGFRMRAFTAVIHKQSQCMRIDCVSLSRWSLDCFDPLRPRHVCTPWSTVSPARLPSFRSNLAQFRPNPGLLRLAAREINRGSCQFWGTSRFWCPAHVSPLPAHLSLLSRVDPGLYDSIIL